jgi:hypothetical protein
MKTDIFNNLDLDKYEILALDLEGTLISNAVSQIPGDGLYEFLEFCKFQFKKIVMFTAVPEQKFREISRTLVSYRDVPSWFESLACIKWNPAEELKDLRKVDKNWGKVLIVYDMEGYILPEQKCNWIKANPIFEY